MNRLRIRHAALLFCALVLVFAVLSAALAIEHGLHECAGHRCPICFWFYRTAKFLQQMVWVTTGSLFAAGLWGLLFAASSGAKSREHSFTLCSLKVRLNQ